VSATAWSIPAERTPLWRDLVALARPRLAAFGLLVVVMAYVIAHPPDPEGWTVFHLVLGSLLVLSGASVLNQVLEREPDGLMRRTSGRPLPAGRIGTPGAAAYGVLLSLVGLAVLALGVGGLTAAAAAAGLAGYVFLYTPMKARTSLSTAIGAVPGAVPVLMGWSAARGAIDGEGWALFWILFLWQLPHFLAIGWLYRHDYRRAGFRMLSVNDPHGAVTSRQAILFMVVLLPVSLGPNLLGLAGPLYFSAALGLGLLYLGAGLAMNRERTSAAARRVLRVSVIYLPLLLILLALDRALF
jgi:protoheme IX farnesyltransferase